MNKFPKLRDAKMWLRKFFSVSRVSSDILKEKQSITLSINKHQKVKLTTL